MPRSREDAIKWGHQQKHGALKWRRACLMFVRMAFGLPGGTPSAGLAWDWAKHRHHVNSGSQVPRGVPVFWETTSAADHVALSLGGGLCLSNDVKRSGGINVVRIDEISRRWNCRLLGWTEDLNGQRVWRAPHKKPAPKPEPKKPSRGPHIDDAIASLHKARGNSGPGRDNKIDVALAALLEIKRV